MSSPRDRLLEELGISRSAMLDRGLREYEEADLLHVADVGDDGREHLLIPEAATAWRRLKAAAADDGVTVYIVSAFRSIVRQAQIVRGKLDRGGSMEDVLTISAAPGFSEHHSGRAVDLGTVGARSLEVEFAQTPAFVWLAANARKFDFVLSYPIGNSLGYQYEPWHWCFRGNTLKSDR